MRPRTDARLLLGVPLVLLTIVLSTSVLSTSGAADLRAPEPDHQEPQTVIRVVATGVHSEKGQVLVALFDSEKGFPDQVDHALQRGIASVHDSEAQFAFAPIRGGTYAVSVLHDEDGDLEMKTGFFGQPKEGWGVSRNANGRFGPPSFEDAAFDAVGDTVLIELKLRY